MSPVGRLLAAPVLAVLVVAAGCGPDARPESAPSPSVSATSDDCGPPNEEAAVTDHWPVPPECELEPYPYVTPTPALEATALDGVYERGVTGRLAGPAGKCRRCPPYRMERGQTNLLMLDRGVFRVVHRPGEWQNVGHFEVDGDTVSFFNDPNCTLTRGAYAWELEGDTLTMRVVEDECAFGGLRARYLTATTWTRIDEAGGSSS
jgi:hypothetical protein